MSLNVCFDHVAMSVSNLERSIELRAVRRRVGYRTVFLCRAVCTVWRRRAESGAAGLHYSRAPVLCAT